MAFVKTEVEKLTLNPFTKIGKEWFLLTSGTPDCYNTMTASWGQMGVLWGKKRADRIRPYIPENL